METQEKISNVRWPVPKLPRLEYRRTIDEIDKLPDAAYISRPELAGWTGTSISTLSRWASDGSGPPITRKSGWIRYRLGDVRAWLAAVSK